MEQELNELYHPLILEHNQYPHHYSKRPDAEVVLDAYNALCGDKFRLYFDVVDGKVVQASFSGYGCAVSKAATSILMDHIQGKSVGEIQELLQQYFAITKGAESGPSEMMAFAAAKKFPGRLKCAVLSWEALEDYFHEK